MAEKQIYGRLKTDLNTAYFNKENMGENLEHFRHEAACYLRGPGQYMNLSFFKLCENLESEGKISCKNLSTLKRLVESAPIGKQQMCDMIDKAEEDIRKCQQGGAGNFHKTDNTTLSFATIQAMGKSDLNRSVGIIKTKINGQRAGSGTGFRFGKNYVMTAYHVLEEVVEHVWGSVKAKVERSSKKEAIDQKIRSMFMMSSADIKPNRQALPFGKLFEYLHEMGLQIEVFDEKWKKGVDIEFGVIEGKATAGKFDFEYDIPFADRDHDVVVLQINTDSIDLPPPLALEENVVAKTVHLFGYPHSSTEIDLRSDIECTIYSDDQELKRDVSKAIEWWRKKVGRDVKNHYAVCHYGNNNQTNTGKMFLHTSKLFEKRASGCPAVTFIKEQPVVQLMYLRGYPEFCYMEQKFPPPEYLFETGVSMPVVTQLLQECCGQIMA